MTPTPEQELALNRAIWNVDETNCTPDGNGGYIVHTEKNYTRDLNAIVDVVQRWCEKRECRKYNITFRNHNLHNYECCVGGLEKGNYKGAGDWVFVSNKNPALALSLAFAKAAGLKGEWDNGTLG